MKTTYVERPTLAAPPYPAELVRASKELLQATVNLVGNPQIRALALKATRALPELAEEIHKSARELGVDPADVALANVSYDLLSVIACSTMVLATPDGPLVARNMDWFSPARIARASAILPARNGRHAGFVGMVGVVTGLSNAGFGIVLNAVNGGGPDFTGYPMLLYLRHVLDSARSFDEAREMLTTAPLMSGGLITLAGSNNSERIVLERTPGRCGCRTEPAGKPLLTTNHYRLDGSTPSCSRYAYMEQHANPDDPLALLCHAEVRQSITGQHVLMRPARKEMKLYVPEVLLTQEDEEDSLESLRGLFR